MDMLNILLLAKGYPSIKVGIGISTAQELVVKAGRRDVGIHSNVCIGSAVTKSSNLSSLGFKNGLEPIVISSCTHNNIIEKLVNIYGEGSRSWFTIHTEPQYETYYDANIVKSEFEKWIYKGMKE